MGVSQQPFSQARIVLLMAVDIMNAKIKQSEKLLVAYQTSSLYEDI